jgi:hypothetical protein
MARLVMAKLTLKEFGVASFSLQQLLVRSVLHDSSVSLLTHHN